MTATDVRPGPDAEAVGHAVTAALRTVDANLAAFGDRYPDDTTVHGRYPLRRVPGGHPEGANLGWTTGFWPGMLWLAFDLTGDERYLRSAASHARDFAAPPLLVKRRRCSAPACARPRHGRAETTPRLRTFPVHSRAIPS